MPAPSTISLVPRRLPSLTAMKRLLFLLIPTLLASAGPAMAQGRYLTKTGRVTFF